MRICYVDESGHCGEKYDPQQPIEVLCGVITDISKLFKTQREHNDILELLSNHGINIDELKAAELYRGRKDWHGIDPKVRDTVYEALLGWSKSRVCKFIVCPIDSKIFFDRIDAKCRFALKFLYPWEAGAFNVILAVQRENHNKKRNKGKTIVIFDEQNKHDNRLLKLFEDDLTFTDGYTCYSPRPKAKSPPRFDQIVDIPHFSKSHLAVLIQLADVAAYIVNRYICILSYGAKEEYDGETNKISRWCEMIRRNMISHTSIDPPREYDLCEFFRTIRPKDWSAKEFVLK